MTTMMIEPRASWLAQLGERRSAEQEVAGSPAGPKLRVFK